MAQLCSTPAAMSSSVQTLCVFPELDNGRVEDHFKNEKLLGCGFSSTVYKCSDKVTNLPYASKVISKNDKYFNVDDVRRETEIMLKLSDRPNVVSLRGFFEDSEYVFLIMDLCSGGDLFDFIGRQHPSGCSEPLVAHVMLQIMSAIRSCHAVGVMHGDIKLENIMLSESNTNEPCIKVIDFGMSKVTQHREKVTTIAGTPRYMAPEVLQKCYGCEADIWSAGIIMYLLITGDFPFDVEGVDICTEFARMKQLRVYQEFEKKLPFSKAYKSISENGRDVLSKMLAVNPSMRLTTDEFFQHPWAMQHNTP